MIPLLLYLVASAAHAANPMPSATTLKQGYLEFRGGEAALRGLRVVEREGTNTAYGPDSKVTGDYHTCVHYPDEVVVRLDAGEAQVAEYLDRGKGFVCRGDFEDCKPAENSRLQSLKQAALTANREILFSTEDWSKGIVSAEGHGVYKVTFPDSYYLFDSASGRLLTQGKGRRSRRYGDWRLVNGVRFPFEIDDYYDGQPRFLAKLTSVTSGTHLSRWCAAHLH